MTNSQTKDRFGLAALLDIPVGIMSALSNEVGSFLLPRGLRDTSDAVCSHGLVGAAD